MAHVMLSDVGSLLASIHTFAPAYAQSPIHPPGGFDAYFQLILRWLHFLAGITWIGILYFFNLVNVNFMKRLDAPTKGKVIPSLMPDALWWFRWGALITVLVGITYYAQYMVAHDAKARDESGLALFGIWLLIVLVTYVIIFFVIQKGNWPAGRGIILAIILAVIVLAMIIVILYTLSKPAISASQPAINQNTIAIGIGGGMGIIMLLNVWGIIWPAQKRIIAWTKANAENGTAIPPEAAGLGRRAFLASRTNAWLSVPMLLFMAISSHFPGLFGR